jgi:hypothetical protein
MLFLLSNLSKHQHGISTQVVTAVGMAGGAAQS